VKFKVLKGFRKDGQAYKRGDVIDIPPTEAAYLRAQKLIGNSIRTNTKTPDRYNAIRHKGAGWYELPNGEKVRGKERAEKLLREVDE